MAAWMSTSRYGSGMPPASPCPLPGAQTQPSEQLPVVSRLPWPQLTIKSDRFPLTLESQILYRFVTWRIFVFVQSFYLVFIDVMLCRSQNVIYIFELCSTNLSCCLHVFLLVKLNLNLLQEILSHTDFVNSVGYNGDSGTLVASAGDDLTARVWDSSSQTQISKFLLTSPGTWLAVACRDLHHVSILKLFTLVKPHTYILQIMVWGSLTVCGAVVYHLFLCFRNGCSLPPRWAWSFDGGREEGCPASVLSQQWLLHLVLEVLRAPAGSWLVHSWTCTYCGRRSQGTHSVERCLSSVSVTLKWLLRETNKLTVLSPLTNVGS